MAPKSKKAAAATGSACITDFFPRRTLSASQNVTPAKSQRPPDQEVISISSTQSHITVSSSASASKSIITVSDTSSFAPSASVDAMESISSRRCPVSKQTSKHASTSKVSTNTPAKRKIKVDDDSELDLLDSIPRSPPRRALAIASIQKPTPFSPKENLTHQLSQTTQTRKKPRLSSPEPRVPSPQPPTTSSEAGDLVPSSQSDEDELVCRGPPVDHEVVMQDVDKWRNDANSPVSLPSEGDVDMPDAAPNVSAVTPESSPEARQELLLLTPLRSQKQPSLVTTPVALTGASKAAQIIADIKAKAYANTLSSPDDSPLGELKELEDSSDEEDLFPTLLPKRDPFSSPLSPVPNPNRYALRDRGGPSIFASPSTSRRTRAPPPRGPVILTKNKEPPKKSVSDDPLGALLREKRRADKDGDRDLALRRAEEAIRAGPSLSYDTDEADLHEDIAANSDMSLNDEDRVRLLGAKQGKAVVGILQSDRATSEDAKGKQKVMGVPLWESGAEHMDVESSIPSLPDGVCEPRVLAQLKSSIDGGDLSRAALVLGVLGNLNLPHEVTSYLCELALSPRDTGLTLPAFHALSQIWGRSSTSAPAIPFRVVLSALVRLGAKHSVLDGTGWAVPDARSEAIQAHEREAALYRLTRLLALSVRSLTLYWLYSSLVWTPPVHRTSKEISPSQLTCFAAHLPRKPRYPWRRKLAYATE
ncbi:hypothetical protein FB45DRAFT_193605 [Roridomyces roridus]|uniref:Uncharacterized protein n=1 Tax=Roridomyces roridus TaxID=1738132 RepID=A0AAD7CF33_9AGAR|nr:hypothetical protein FB45DRAFT_193605 [Roridomyces roridus]